MSLHAKSRLIVSVVMGLAVLALGAYALQRMDPYGENPNRLSKRFEYDLQASTTIDEQDLGYRETGAWPLNIQQVRAIAVGTEERVYVAGDSQVVVCDAAGQARAAFPLSAEPRCLGVGGPAHKFPGAVYVGLTGRVVRLDDQGGVAAEWSEGLNESSVLTSLAAADEDLFVADAGNRVVLRYDLEGKLLKRLGERDPERGVRGLIVPSPYLDIALSADGLLRVVNPGALRIEAYNLDGDLLGHWGKASAELDGFFGCCNPANFAVLGDGRFVTVEKGLPRVKVYSRQGELESVVAGPRELAPGTAVEDARDEHRLKTFDVAADSAGRILVLDPNTRQVRVFEKKARSES